MAANRLLMRHHVTTHGKQLEGSYDSTGDPARAGIVGVVDLVQVEAWRLVADEDAFGSPLIEEAGGIRVAGAVGPRW